MTKSDNTRLHQSHFECRPKFYNVSGKPDDDGSTLIEHDLMNGNLTYREKDLRDFISNAVLDRVIISDESHVQK